MKNSIFGTYVGEFLGTFFLVLFGVGAVCTSFTGAYPGGLWDISIIFGFGVAFGIYGVAATSGGHINPAVTIAMAVHRDFPWKRVPGYIISQIAGGFFGSAVLYFFYGPFIAKFEAANNIVRGQAGSQLSAMTIGGGYFPNPALVGTSADAMSLVPLSTAFLSQALWTALLVFFVFVFTDPKNEGVTKANLAGLMIGIFVAIAIALEAPLTMTNINPARDLGPRIFSYFAGWGRIAFPGPRNGFWIYTIAPIVGGIVGGWVYDNAVRRYFLGETSEPSASVETTTN